MTKKDYFIIGVMSTQSTWLISGLTDKLWVKAVLIIIPFVTYIVLKHIDKRKE